MFAPEGQEMSIADIKMAADALEDSKPKEASLEQRLEMTAKCRDCDSLEKVPDAGKLFDLPDGSRTQLMHNGIRVLAGGYYGEWMQRLIARCSGHHEPQEERLFYEVLKFLPSDAIMLELGGFWLYYSIWFLKDAPKRRAIAVEPDPTHIAVGQVNAALNECQIECLQGFVGAKPEVNRPFRTEHSGEISIPCIAVPELLSERGINYLDLLHCDAQGAEYSVIESCVDLFSSGRIGWVFVSTHADVISGDPLMHQRCLTLLRRCGATVVAEHDVHESFSGDGLIVAKFGELAEFWRPVELSRNRYSESLFRNPLYDVAALRRDVQVCKAQLAQAEMIAAEMAEQCRAEVAATASMRSEIADLKASLSWRVTRPLRLLKAALRDRGRS